MTQKPLAPDGVAAFYGWPSEMVAPSPPKPRLFSWDVPDRRTGGVTDDLDRAHQHVMDALWESDPGTEGQVRRVTLATTAPSTYTDCGMVAHARRLLRDVVWDPA